MALLFSEGFEATLLSAFWPPEKRFGSHNFIAVGRTNNQLSLPTNNESDPDASNNSYLTFQFGPLGHQSGKKLFVGFAARNFKTKVGASDGSVTTRQNFFRLLDENGDVALSFEFKKNLAGDNFLELIALDGDSESSNILDRYVLSTITTVTSPSPANSPSTNLMSHVNDADWFYFEWEFDLNAATPTVKMWINGLRATGAETSANIFSAPNLTTISGFELHGSRQYVERIVGGFPNGVTVSSQFDDLYVSDNLAADFNPQEATALQNRLGAAKVYSRTFSSTGSRTTNWSLVGATDFDDALRLEDGNVKYAASNLLDAALLTRMNGPTTLLNFERIAAVQVIYSAAAAGSLPAALMPTMDDNTPTSTLVNLAAAPDVFEPEEGYVAQITTVQTDPITNQSFTLEAVGANTATNAGRRIGLRVATAPEIDT